MLKPDFDENCIVTGTVVNVVKEKSGENSQPAGLQFMSETDRKMIFVDLKVLGTIEKDLEQFLNKKVTVKYVKVFQVDYNKYYKTEDISNISILK